MTHYDLIGRKAILKFFGLTDWRQVEARIHGGCPIVREGGIGRWLANSKAVEDWIGQGGGGAGGEKTKGSAPGPRWGR